MKRILAFMALVLLAGCNAAKQVNANVAGKWKIVLGENQSAAYQTTDTTPTAIAISLKQSDSILFADTTQKIWAGNTACKGVSGSWWSLSGGWNPNPIGIASLDSGLVSVNSVSLNFTEGVPGSASGQLKLIGTVQSDGSLSGTLTDSCTMTSGNPTNSTWTAQRLSSYPPVVWP